MRVAALDLGSNSFLLLVQEKNPDGKIVTLHDESIIVRLGEGIHKTQTISDEALKRAAECLKSFKATINKLNPQKVEAVTTAVARDAKNSSVFLDLCKSHGINVKVLTGDQEARMSYQGAVGENENSRCILLDIGGGSTESIIGEKGSIHFAESLSFGAVKMTEKFITAQPTKNEDIQNLRNYLNQECEAVWKQLKNLKPDKMIAVAGTPTAIAACEVGHFDALKIEGIKLSTHKLDFWIKEFSSLSIESKKQKYPLGKRADIILAGSIILQEYLKAVQLSELIVSTKGIRYGLAQSLFTLNH